MKFTTHRFFHAGIVTLSAGLTVGASGCSASSSPSPKPADIATSYDDLTTDLSVCERSRVTCLDAADGDRPKIDDCQSEVADCRTAVAAARSEVHTALRACVDTARACIRSIGDGGMTAAEACATAFHACVKEAIPPPPPLPPCLSALKDCLSMSADGGQSVDAKTACFTQFRTCAIAELPPCAHGLATCVEGGGDIRSCWMTARDCRDFRLSHDGGVPPSMP